MSKMQLPAMLKYPKLPDVDQCPQIRDQYCYIVEAYKPGFAVLLKRTPPSVAIQVGDWAGKIIDISKKSDDSQAAITYINKHLDNIIRLLQVIRLTQAQLFISGGMLVDMQVAANKFAGPGMLRDLFSKITPVQRTIGIEVMNEDKLKAVKAGNGIYKPGIILKPTRFRTIDDGVTPLYATVRCSLC